MDSLSNQNIKPRSHVTSVNLLLEIFKKSHSAVSEDKSGKKIYQKVNVFIYKEGLYQ